MKYCCSVCGSEWEHNPTEMVRRRDVSHAERDCIVALRRRIEQLEHAVVTGATVRVSKSATGRKTPTF